MTPHEQLDIFIAVLVEYGHPPTLKDLFRLRELMPDSPPYAHPIRVRAPEPEEVELVEGVEIVEGAVLDQAAPETGEGDSAVEGTEELTEE